MRKTYVNLICSIVVFIINVLVSFFLSPFIVKHIGVEANGFVTLASNFVMYATLLVTALNSMAARFISIAYVKKDYKKANLFYNSVFWGNILIVLVLILPSLYFLFKLDSFVEIPKYLILDVKLLFAFVFFNFFLTTGLPNWDCGTFVSNRLDLSYKAQIFATIIKSLLLVVFLVFFTPKVFYVGLVSTLYTIIMLFFNMLYTKNLTPELKVNFKRITFTMGAIRELVFSGIWNSISSIGMMFLTGVDLIICNVFLGPTSMGILSLTKFIPNYMDQFSSSIVSAFTPELTINYANGNLKKMNEDIIRSMKLCSILLTIPIAIFIIFGEDFFNLWIPNQNAKLLQVLSILASFKFLFTSGIQILYNVFPTVNKVKENAISQIVTGFVSVILTILLVKYTKYGMYAVAGVSSICIVIKNLVYIVPVCAVYLGLKWNSFYKQVFISLSSSIIILIVGIVYKKIFVINSWIDLIFSCLIVSIFGLFVNIFINTNKLDRKMIKEKILKKYKEYV